jgi:hypothetical protein
LNLLLISYFIIFIKKEHAALVRRHRYKGEFLLSKTYL